MNNKIIEGGPPVVETAPGDCEYEYVVPDVNDSSVEIACGEPATRWPVLDDSRNAHLRAAGKTGDEFQPSKLALCDEHYKQLLVDIAEQDGSDPYRVWIAAEPKVVEIGWTLSDRENGYVSYMDGWRAGAAQHAVSIEVDLPPDLPPYKVADLVFLATNAPDLEGHPDAAKILAAVQATGYRGVEGGHFSLSVGDTVTVDGMRLACEDVRWKDVS
ncbi:hypothetical protein ACFVWG_24135 [Kribbella sp. NPDC058245]|uniref:hypothetical protein n=1 Tax=Kribbella sp. NPDC058245 TaxID=3346399 RepID=UPI0036F158D7